MKTDLVVTGHIFNEGKLLLIHHNKLDMWLPVGGHIDNDETPDDALKREIKEETNLDVEILSNQDMPLKGSTKRILAIPFHVEVHSVGDHDHCSFFYLCKPKNTEHLKINKELKNFKWVTKQELNQPSIHEGIREVCIKAFDMYEKLI